MEKKDRCAVFVILQEEYSQKRNKSQSVAILLETEDEVRVQEMATKVLSLTI